MKTSSIRCFLCTPHPQHPLYFHSRNTCRTLRACTVCTSYSACCCSRIVSTTPPPSFQSPSLPRQDPLPLIPTSRPSVLTYVPLHFLIYDLISTEHTVKVCERPFVRTLWSHCPPKPSRFTLLSLDSIFICIHISGLLRGRGDLRFTSHKSSAHFTSRCFGSYSAQLYSVLARRGSFTLAAQEEIPSWCLPHSRSSAVTYAAVNPIGTELCQTRTLLINGVWKGVLHSCFFSHNYCLFSESEARSICHIAKHMY